MKQKIEDLKIYHTLCKVMSKTQAKCELMKIKGDKVEFKDQSSLECAFQWYWTPQGWDFWLDVQWRLQQLEE